MTLRATVGPESNLFEESPHHCRKLQLVSPILRRSELEQIRALDRPGLRSTTLTALFDSAAGVDGLERAIQELQTSAENAVQQGATLLVISDRGSDAELAALVDTNNHAIRVADLELVQTQTIEIV